MTTAVATTKAIGFKMGGDANMTHRQGQINTSYDILVAVFGQPDPGSIDPYKSDAGWTITFADGVVVTIYNWKNGPVYGGDPVEEITLWNIGGHSNTGAVSRVEEVIGSYLDMVCGRGVYVHPLADSITKLVAAL